MVTIYPDNSLASLVIVAVSLATAAVSYFLARRWHWKAVPLVVLAGLLVPINGRDSHRRIAADVGR